jgi:hypothetical protein
MSAPRKVDSFSGEYSRRQGVPWPYVGSAAATPYSAATSFRLESTPTAGGVTPSRARPVMTNGWTWPTEHVKFWYPSMLRFGYALASTASSQAGIPARSATIFCPFAASAMFAR